jgi:hypothetical protein
LAVLKEVEIAPRQPLLEQVSAYLLDNPTPPSLMVAGVDSDGVTYPTFGDAVRVTLLVEACLGFVSDIGSQKALNRLLASSGETSVVEAGEADQSLTSRLKDNGQILTAQEAVADSVSFQGYRGQSRFILPNRAEVLLATWAFEVLT